MIYVCSFPSSLICYSKRAITKTFWKFNKIVASGTTMSTDFAIFVCNTLRFMFIGCEAKNFELYLIKHCSHNLRNYSR